MRLRHGRLGLELHERRAGGDGPTLLLLHELYGSASGWDRAVDAWPGRVAALDFCGHGASDWLAGGAYLPEMLLGDADAALAEVGPAVLLGEGLGAYVALLLAGARRGEVAGALLFPGCGLEGGGAEPDFGAPAFAAFLAHDPAARGGSDPRAHVLEKDVRPPDYAERFARAARCLLLAEDGAPRPAWWEAARRSPAAVRVAADRAGAIAELLRVATAG